MFKLVGLCFGYAEVAHLGIVFYIPPKEYENKDECLRDLIRWLWEEHVLIAENGGYAPVKTIDHFVEWLVEIHTGTFQDYPCDDEWRPWPYWVANMPPETKFGEIVWVNEQAASELVRYLPDEVKERLK